MPREVKIKVPQGLKDHHGVVHEVVLQEPSWTDYFERGECIEYISYPNGMTVPTVNNATVESYVSCCLVRPKDPLILHQGGLSLAKEVRSAIINFIHGGRSEDGPSETPPKTSSGTATADSPPAT